jgi:hypothetical protein
MSEVDRIRALPLEERQRLRERLLRTANLAVPAVQEMLMACACAPPKPKPTVRERVERQPTYGPKGWVDPVPLSSPPGVVLCDRMMDAQDRRDRADLIDAEIKRRLRR